MVLSKTFLKTSQTTVKGFHGMGKKTVCYFAPVPPPRIFPTPKHSVHFAHIICPALRATLEQASMQPLCKVGNHGAEP